MYNNFKKRHLVTNLMCQWQCAVLTLQTYCPKYKGLGLIYLANLITTLPATPAAAPLDTKSLISLDRG